MDPLVSVPVQPSPIGTPHSAQLNSHYNMLNGSESVLVGTHHNDVGTSPHHTFSLAPGDGRASHGQSSSGTSSTTNQTVVLDYKNDFPELPPTQPSTVSSSTSKTVQSSAWGKPLPKLRSSVVTQVFHLPAEERSYRDFASDRQFGDTKSQEQDACNEIANTTGTQIELCESRDHTLTIVLTGKRQALEEARKLVVQQLQTQASKEIRIPKEHHRVIIGKEGKRLQDLQAETDCRIIVPLRDNQSDIIKVIGPKEGIERALVQIQIISDEQSKLAQEHLVIPRIYYPFIRGPFNETYDRIVSETEGARINIPPPSSNSEVIVITGEKEKVHRAAAIIKQIFEEKQRICKTITCSISKPQHRFIIGPQRTGLAEVLKETGVSVEVPAEDDESDTVTLRGDPAMLALALPLVYQKASSVITSQVQCPAWLHRFLIGQKGSGIRQIVGEHSKAQVDFEDNGTIYLEGPPEQVRDIEAKLRLTVQQLQADMDFRVVKVPPTHHRHIIGKAGATIGKLKQEHGVQISIPDESTNSDEIRIEGPREGVKKAAEEIAEIATRLENEKTRDILIEQRFHRQIIGAKGEAIRELRDQFPGVQVTFPEAGRKSDVVNMRGPKDQLDKCHKHLTALAKDLKDANFQVHVPIFKDFHKIIIGKGGSNIRKIREETNCRIDLPAEDAGDDIVVTGRKENVEKAVAMLQKIQNELANIITGELKIPSKISARMLGGGGRMIADIADQCGGVQIKFPDPKSNSETVVIRGPKEDVAKALKLLTDLAKDRELSSHEDSIKFKPELRRFLIGRGGATIRKVRDVCPDVRIIFPRDNDPDQETIHLIGRKEEVGKVKTQLETLIKELAETVEVFTQVEPKWHKHFVARGAAILRDIQDQCGGVLVSFPKMGTNDSKVSIKGSKDCCEEAKKRITEIVSDLENSVSNPFEIHNQHHRYLLGNRGQKIHEIQTKCSVQIKFPDRRDNENGQPAVASEPVEGIKLEHMVMLTGRPENIQKAKEELLALVPITQSLFAPYDMHRMLIGKGGQEIRNYMQEFEVNVKIPPADEKRDEIEVSGTPANVSRAAEELIRKVDRYNEEAKDRQLRSYEAFATVPVEYHSRLIGPKGATITSLRKKFDVNISIPPPNSNPVNPSQITIIGYQDRADACKTEIERIIGDIQQQFKQEITLDNRIHPRIIGQKGKTIRKIMDDYKVEVRFPRETDSDPNLVVVTGRDENAVYDCIDELRNMEEEFLQDITERGTYQRVEPSESKEKQAADKTMEMRNAPWNPNSASDFPAMGNGDNGGNAHSAVPSAWGPGRRHAQ